MSDKANNVGIFKLVILPILAGGPYWMETEDDEEPYNKECWDMAVSQVMEWADYCDKQNATTTEVPGNE